MEVWLRREAAGNCGRALPSTEATDGLSQNGPALDGLHRSMVTAPDELLERKEPRVDVPELGGDLAGLLGEVLVDDTDVPADGLGAPKGDVEALDERLEEGLPDEGP